MTKSQIDRLGEKLRREGMDGETLIALATYRNDFIPATDEVAKRILKAQRSAFKVDITQRPAKSTASIIAKLRREHCRLSQIQDIGGLRVVVSKVSVQDSALKAILHEFDQVRVVDRRTQPQHGYRAIHAIVTLNDILIEVQIRTLLQNLWAQYSEKLSDTRGNELKYGIGDPTVLAHLADLGQRVANFEQLERSIDDMGRSTIRPLHEKKRMGTLTPAEAVNLRNYQQLLAQKRAWKQQWRAYFEEAAR